MKKTLIRWLLKIIGITSVIGSVVFYFERYIFVSYINTFEVMVISMGIILGSIIYASSDFFLTFKETKESTSNIEHEKTLQRTSKKPDRNPSNHIKRKMKTIFKSLLNIILVIINIIYYGVFTILFFIGGLGFFNFFRVLFVGALIEENYLLLPYNPVLLMIVSTVLSVLWFQIGEFLKGNISLVELFSSFTSGEENQLLKENNERFMRESTEWTLNSTNDHNHYH